MEETVKQMICESLELRLSGWGDIDNILNNDALIKRWITDIMALGYNNCNVDDAAKDIFEIQSVLCKVSIEDIRARLTLSLNRFSDEIAAFQKYVELRERDEDTIEEAVASELEFVKEGDFIIG